MNPKIITHLLKSDWLRLRGWIVAYWLLLLVAGWQALSFSVEGFDTPPDWSRGVSSSGDIEQHMHLIGADFGLRDWIQRIGAYLSTGTGVVLAAALGFHGRSWTQVRPARRREAVASKGLALLLLVALPPALMEGSIALTHEMGFRSTLDTVSGNLSHGFPLAVAACLFGAVCGGLWSWVAGMFALTVTFMVLPPMLMSRGFGLSLLHPSPLFLWTSVVVLCVVTFFSDRFIRPVTRIGVAILGLFAAGLFPLIPFMIKTWSGDPLVAWKSSGETLPPWDGEAEPVLMNVELAGENINDTDRDVAIPTEGLGEHRERLEIPLQWATRDLPTATAVDWKRNGKAEIRTDGRVISSDPGPYDIRRPGFTGPDYDRRVIGSEAVPGHDNLRWTFVGYEQYRLTDGPAVRPSLLAPVKETGIRTANLTIDLEGTVHRYEKLLDVPFGAPVKGMIEGMEVHVRRTDIPGVQPAVDFCYMIREDLQAGVPEWVGRQHPGQDWIVVLHFPDSGECRFLDRSISATRVARLARGCCAVRKIYLTEEKGWRGRETSAKADGVRLLVLRRVDLGTLKRHYESAELPLVVRENRRAIGGGSGIHSFREAPPFRLRPDPATADEAALGEWMSRMQRPFISGGYGARDLAEFVPRHLDFLLGRPDSVMGSSSVQGNAVALACPESRREEVFGALLRRNARPYSNWVPETILKRGWTDAARPEILKIAAEGKTENSWFIQMMISRLEDPQTYPTILEREITPASYQSLLMLPGIDAAVNASFLKADAAARRKEPDWTLRKELTVSALAAADGNSQAFSRMIEAWEKADPKQKEDSGQTMTHLILIPGQPEDWHAARIWWKTRVPGWLEGKTAGDFEYDRLARLWVARNKNAP